MKRSGCSENQNQKRKGCSAETYEGLGVTFHQCWTYYSTAVAVQTLTAVQLEQVVDCPLLNRPLGPCPYDRPSPCLPFHPYHLQLTVPTSALVWQGWIVVGAFVVFHL